MRRIALVNQKGGVGKTTTAANLGAALAYAGRRVLLLDLDPQGNLSTHLSVEVPPGRPSTYSVLCEGMPLVDAMVPTAITNLSIVGTNIDLSGAEMELAAAIGRESILNDAVDDYIKNASDEERFDYLIFDCPPSLGLLSVNGLVAAREVFIALQTEFFALQGMSKLVEIVQLLKRRLNPELEISGIIPCLYDSRLRLAREVLAEIRRYFPGPVFRRSIRANVKLAEAPSYGQSIFEYAPSSPGASDYAELAQEVIAQEAPGSVPERAAAPVEKAAVPAQFQTDTKEKPDPVTEDDKESAPDDAPNPSDSPSMKTEQPSDSAETQTQATADLPTDAAAPDNQVDPHDDSTHDDNTHEVELTPVATHESADKSTDESTNESTDEATKEAATENASAASKELNAFAAQLASDAPIATTKDARNTSADALENELAALTRRSVADERKTHIETDSPQDDAKPHDTASQEDSSAQATQTETPSAQFASDILQPMPPPTSSPMQHSAPPERSILRADDLPPLPEDAFRVGER